LEGDPMPEISRFFGIIITVFVGDHSPPHFHARYGDDKATFTIDAPALLTGYLPPRVVGLIIEWATSRGLESRLEPVEPIAPLE
jgi:hypothetical protein